MPAKAGIQHYLPSDEQLLSDFPNDVDLCGEHGEFHTFVYDGPMFCNSIPISTDVVVERNGCIFIDIMNADNFCREQQSIIDI